MVPSYDVLAPHYDQLWSGMVVRAEHEAGIRSICSKLIEGKNVYASVAKDVWGDGKYWWFVAITDQMEGGGGHRTHLHNGDSLHDYTHDDPAGRPHVGHEPPFTFNESAVDALQGVSTPISISLAAFNWEKYNGWGYLNKPIQDPYLASFSNMYEKGKWIRDHVYDENAVSNQPGALTILKVLIMMDSTIQESLVGPHDPLPPQKPKSVPTEPNVVQTTKGHIVIDVSGAAAAAEKVVEQIAKVEPTVATMASMFVPGAAPVVATVQPMVLLAIPYIERALNDIASGNGGDLMNALIELLQHNTKGHPNSAALAP